MPSRKLKDGSSSGKARRGAAGKGDQEPPHEVEGNRQRCHKLGADLSVIETKVGYEVKPSLPHRTAWSPSRGVASCCAGGWHFHVGDLPALHAHHRPGALDIAIPRKQGNPQHGRSVCPPHPPPTQADPTGVGRLSLPCPSLLRIPMTVLCVHIWWPVAQGRDREKRTIQRALFTDMTQVSAWCTGPGTLCQTKTEVSRSLSTRDCPVCAGHCLRAAVRLHRGRAGRVHERLEEEPRCVASHLPHSIVDHGTKLELCLPLYSL